MAGNNSRWKAANQSKDWRIRRTRNRRQKDLAGKPKKRDKLEDLGLDGQENIQHVSLWNTVTGRGRDSFRSEQGPAVGYFQTGNERLDCIKVGEPG
jgi:hypothetical protein